MAELQNIQYGGKTFTLGGNQIYIYEITDDGFTPDASGIVYEKTVPAGVRTEILEKVRAGLVVYLKLVNSSDQRYRLYPLHAMDSDQLEGENFDISFTTNSLYCTHIYIGGNSNNTIIRFREASVGGGSNILESPNGTKYRLIVANDGTLSTEAVV